MADQTHLNEILASTNKPLSRKLVETFRDCVRDTSIAKSDYAQRLRDDMEAALQEGSRDEAR
jgi:hypothetical protein